MTLSVRSLSFVYEGSGKPALDSVSLDVGANEYVALLGANGSGKSTLARCVAGLLVPSSGSVGLTGDPGRSVPVAMVFQSPSDQIVAETVELDVAFGPENIGLSRAEMRSRVEASLNLFSLFPLAASPTGSLPAGRKQHLALAGADALDPSLLVLDEPTSMLDPAAREGVLDYLDRYHSSGGTIIHVTHDLGEAVRAGRVVVLDDGKKVFDGSVASFSAISEALLDGWGLRARAVSVVPGAAPRDGLAPVLSCRNVCAGPLRDFSADILPGTVTAVTGASGSGKSLLLEILAGLRQCDAGSFSVNPGVGIALAVQESEASLFAEFVADDVAFAPKNEGLEGAALVGRVRRAMGLAGLPFDLFADRRTFSLSGGERRKAALAGIIAMDTPVLLLDEPTSALDARSRGQLLSLMGALKNEGKTIVFTTNRDEECLIADAVIRLSPAEGQIKEESRQKRTREQETLYALRHTVSESSARVDSPLSRLPPAVKYLFVACAAAAALAVRGWPWLCVLVLCEFVPVVLSRYPPGRLALGIAKIAPWLLLFAVLQYLMVPDIRIPAVFALRFVALYIPLVLFVFVTSQTEIMYGMEDVLRPLRLFRVPVRDIALVTGIVFRFIPLLYEEAARITAARMIRSRGGVGKIKRGLSAKIAAMASLFVPLSLRTLLRSERLAQAVSARYYGSGKNSRYLYWKITVPQSILVVAVPVLTGLLILASWFSGIW